MSYFTCNFFQEKQIKNYCHTEENHSQYFQRYQLKGFWLILWRMIWFLPLDSATNPTIAFLDLQLCMRSTMITNQVSKAWDIFDSFPSFFNDSDHLWHRPKFAKQSITSPSFPYYTNIDDFSFNISMKKAYAVCSISINLSIFLYY